MRRFLCCNEAFAEKKSWQNDCWICIELPTEQDDRYLIQELNIPQAFLSDIHDVDERPRIEIEDGWTLMILAYPLPGNGKRYSLYHRAPGDHYERTLFRDRLPLQNGHVA